MDFTTVTGPIAKAWINAFNTVASGNLKAGQGVVYTSGAVMAPTETTRSQYAKHAFGVVAYDATHKDLVSVYTYGTVVRTRVSGAVKPGQPVYLAKDGFFRAVDANAMKSGNSCGVAIDDAANDEIAQILLG
jgi:hypothetical protein